MRADMRVDMRTDMCVYMCASSSALVAGQACVPGQEYGRLVCSRAYAHARRHVGTSAAPPVNTQSDKLPAALDLKVLTLL